ncbi:DUF4148 domain-containing protein [Variovorax terrae]|uniref:DUF4148 domain-containing protein n=1 Tax=Variovorax terrae TaxID=2923278 RepID=A0A9X2AKZ9_9BURK|nr:DUF4148 domain-containing protein [Variovorax terrae]MCJ0762108.1 DUF4148 domain-containing protein [Variovorax terrae]
MNASKFFAVAAFAGLASMGAQAAGNDDPSQYVLQFNSVRPRAEVQAEAVTKARNPNFEPAGSRVLAVAPSKLERKDVRAQAAVALRQGLIADGEV